MQTARCCCFAQALQAWYQDVVTAPSGSTGKAAGYKAPATPFGKLQLTTPIKTTRATATAAAARSGNEKSSDVSPGGGATSPLAKLGIHTPQDKLKGQPQPDSLQVWPHACSICCNPVMHFWVTVKAAVCITES